MIKDQVEEIKNNHYMELFEQSCGKHGLLINILIAQCLHESGGKNILGDGGHGRGLMQIDDRAHPDWLAANKDGLDPASNIDYACQLMSDLVAHYAGDYHHALAAYNSGMGNVHRAMAHDLPDEEYTAHHNYATAIIAASEEVQKYL